MYYIQNNLLTDGAMCDNIYLSKGTRKKRKKVHDMTTKRIKGHEHAQVKINYYNDYSTELISYSTIVITIDADGWLHVNGLYSMTTIKHIGWFMKMHGLTYQTAKTLFNNRQDINLETGELRNWE